MKSKLKFLFPSLILTSVSVAQPIAVPMGPVATDPAWWSQLAGSPTHSTTPYATGPYLSTPTWTTTGNGSITLSFTPQSGVVADDQRVYALGFDQGFAHHLAAFDQDTGTLAWATPIPFALLDSWSMPAIDSNNDTIIVATGFSILALNRFTGDVLWTTNLDTPMVNASPCLTTDLPGSNRIFITDYTFSSGATGSLICINVDPNTPTNPYEPGQILWTAPLPGDCSGNTPAYNDGIVYVSTADDGSGGPGHILAFDATSTTTPNPLWNTQNSQPLGFFSAVTYHDGHVYASSYNFNGLQRSANTIKLNATTGNLIWSVPTVRTDASPIILPNGNIIISGGLPTPQTPPTTFFTGSLPAIELINDQGPTATVLWDTFEATHQDLNNNGTWDPGEPYLSLGSWAHHPIAFLVNRKNHLLVATMTPPTNLNPFTHASDLHTIDLTKHPTDPNFIISTQPNTGTTPALFGNRIFSTSATGLSALTLNHTPNPLPITQRIRSIVDGHTPIKSLKPTP